jgi:hypothetical protein
MADEGLGGNVRKLTKIIWKLTKTVWKYSKVV